MAPRLGRLVLDAEIEGCDPSTDTPLPVKVAGTTSSGEEATLTQGMYPGEPLSIEPGAYEVAVLRVPDDSGVTYRIGGRSLWEGTGTYVWLIELYQEGKAVASAFCTYDGAPARSIAVYHAP